ncbi:hypothetical protein [Chlorobium limicola]|uniref:hypothetical protein n=1 Tax=Chlorobium limicola TaxID=1092 RepID=UPI001232E735|nr:hypothetical protein [Chlorobium limicola]
MPLAGRKRKRPAKAYVQPLLIARYQHLQKKAPVLRPYASAHAASVPLRSDPFPSDPMTIHRTRSTTSRLCRDPGAQHALP